MVLICECMTPAGGKAKHVYVGRLQMTLDQCIVVVGVVVVMVELPQAGRHSISDVNRLPSHTPTPPPPPLFTCHDPASL